MIKQQISKYLNTNPTIDQIDLIPPIECTHAWVLFAKNFAPARINIPEGLEGDVMEKALLGVTTYMWECRMCSRVRKEESLGSDENHLDDLLDKVDKLGVQYVEHDGKVFAVARVPADEARLPVK